MFKEVAGRILAFWGLTVFVVSMVIFSVPVWIAGLWAEPLRSKIAYWFYLRWMWVFFVFSGIRRKFVGREHFKTGQNYIVICNHRSLLDPPLSSPAIPGPNKTIAKVEMARIPIFGILYRRGSVLVDRKNEESRRASFGKMKEVLEMGLHMCIYPEGTRNKTNEPLQRFHDGAFRLAIDTGKPIIPALLFNTDKVFPRKTFFFWPQKVEMHFLPAISVEGKTVQQVKEESFRVMKAYYIQHS